MLTEIEIEKAWKQIGEQTCPDCKESNKDCKRAIPTQMFYVVKALHTTEDGEGEKDLKLTQIDFIEAIINCIKRTEYYSSDQRAYNIDALQSLIDGFELLKSYDPSSSMQERLSLRENIESTVKFGDFLLPNELEWYLAFWFTPSRSINVAPKNEDERLVVFQHKLNKELEEIKDQNVRSSLFKQKWIYKKYVDDYNSSKPIDESMALKQRIQDLKDHVSKSNDVVKLGYDYAMKGNYNERANISKLLDYKRFAFGMNLAEVMGFLMAEEKGLTGDKAKAGYLSDIDFIKGHHRLSFTASDNDDGFFKVTKEGATRQYTIQQYFNLELRNWEEVINGSELKMEKIKAANNAIFHFRQHYLDHTHPGIIGLKEKTVQHLMHIVEHIEAVYEDGAVQSVKNEQHGENDIILSTIEDWLYPFKDEGILDSGNYHRLLAALKEYFDEGKFPPLKKSIKVGKVNKKRFGWALNQIYRSNKSGNEPLPIAILDFANSYISIYGKDSFDAINYMKSNLYKYLTTKTL